MIEKCILKILKKMMNSRLLWIIKKLFFKKIQMIFLKAYLTNIQKIRNSRLRWIIKEIFRKIHVRKLCLKKSKLV